MTLAAFAGTQNRSKEEPLKKTLGAPLAEKGASISKIALAIRYLTGKWHWECRC